MEPLAYRKMDFEEFCAAAISTYQLEALDRWEDIASTAFEHFETEGNRMISVEELARVITFFSFSNTQSILSIHMTGYVVLQCLYFLCGHRS